MVIELVLLKEEYLIRKSISTFLRPEKEPKGDTYRLVFQN